MNLFTKTKNLLDLFMAAILMAIVALIFDLGLLGINPAELL